MPTFKAIGVDPIEYTVKKPRPTNAGVAATGGQIYNQPIVANATTPDPALAGQDLTKGFVQPSAVIQPEQNKQQQNQPAPTTTLSLAEQNAALGNTGMQPRPTIQPAVYQPPAVDEAKIREEELARQRERINALNALYDVEYKKAAERGKARLGSQYGLSAARGTLGSSFGQAENAAVQDINTAEEQSLQARQRAEIQAIMDNADKSIQDRVKEANAALERHQARADQLQKEQEQLALQKDSIAYQRKQAESKGIQPIEIDGSLVNPSTGEVIYKSEKKPTYASGSVGEYQFYAAQEKEAGRQPISYNEYQNLDANRKAKIARAGSTGSGGGPLGGKLSSMAESVLANPALLDGLTPTVRGKIIDELSRAGKDLSKIALPKLAANQREQLSSFDDLLEEASNAAQFLVQKKPDLGPIASRVKGVGAFFGGAPEYTQYRSIIDNLGSQLVKLRSGSAVTPQEFERISGFIPQTTDDEKTAEIKIKRFEEATKKAQQNYINRATQTSQQVLESSQPKQTNSDPIGIR